MPKSPELEERDDEMVHSLPREVVAGNYGLFTGLRHGVGFTVERTIQNALKEMDRQNG